MDTGNYRRRLLHKLAKDLELPKLTFPSDPAHDSDAGAKNRERGRTFRDFSGIPARPQRPTWICRRSRRASQQPSTRLMLNSEWRNLLPNCYQETDVGLGPNRGGSAPFTVTLKR